MNHLRIDKSVLCGYSTGSQILLEFAHRYPERLIGGVLIGGMPVIRDRRLKTLARLGILSTKRAFMPVTSFCLSLTNAASFKQFSEIYRFARKSDAVSSEQYFRCSLTFDCCEQLPDMKQPMLLICGERDHWAMQYGQFMHKLLPNSEFVLIAKVGHRIPSQAPEALSQLIANFVLRHNECLPLNELAIIAET